MEIIDGGEANTIAAYDNTSKTLILVTINYGTAQNVTYDLSKFASVGITAHATDDTSPHAPIPSTPSSAFLPASFSPPAASTVIRRWRTEVTVEGGDRYVAYDDTRLENGTMAFTCAFSANTIQTFEVDNAVIRNK
jgi:galactan endo-1,6-beta-galactosidase